MNTTRDAGLNHAEPRKLRDHVIVTAMWQQRPANQVISRVIPKKDLTMLSRYSTTPQYSVLKNEPHSTVYVPTTRLIRLLSNVELETQMKTFLISAVFKIMLAT